MVSKVHSAQVSGLRPDIIDVEVDMTSKLHSFAVVGLPDKAVEEARDRISSAIKNSGFKSPLKQNKKIVISLAPADIKKEGPVFDLAIALAYLISAENIFFDPSKKIFLGELSLNGELRPIRGVLPIIEKAKQAGFEEIYLPEGNAREAAIIPGIKIFGASSLKEVINHLLQKDDCFLEQQEQTEIISQDSPQQIDFSDVKGQESAKRGLIISAAGRHNIAMSGPPGTGKTMLARAFLGVLPDLEFNQVLETTGIHSVAGFLEDDYMTTPPLRSPHHSASHVALVGGGANPRPGEITLAHNGVLFLDEFPEFERRVIESLRQPLEDRIVTVSRAKGTETFPANFILIATMNPCPCGNRGVKGKACICLPSAIQRYERKISGPIVDRIDLWLDVPQVDYEKLSDKRPSGQTSKEFKEKILVARGIQRKRFESEPDVSTNSEMGVKALKKYVQLSDDCVDLLNESAKRLDLSARAYHRVIKLARTIADLENCEDVLQNHLLEALQYRPKKII